MGLRRGSFILMSMLLLSACVRERIVEIREPSPNAKESFKLPGETAVQATTVGLSKHALNRHFLLLPSARAVSITTQWEMYAPVIVYFERAGDSLALFQVNHMSVYEELGGAKLLQSFKVSTETQETIFFQWGTGLSLVVNESPFWFPDNFGFAEEKLGAGADVSLQVVSSFTKAVTLSDTEIVIDQVARVRTPTTVVSEAQAQVLSQINLDNTIEVSYRLRPYRLNGSFTPKKSQIKKGLGYFTIPHNEKNYGNISELIIRWDTNPERSPIRALISSSTPTNYVQAIKEGLEYWNRVAEREIIKVETGVDPKTPPAERTIMVHWIPWEDAGFAYAMMQADPLTGETLQAQIFMTSAFLGMGKALAINEPEENRKVASIGLNSFRGSRTCYLEASKFESLLGLTLEKGRSTLEIEKSVIRNVIAHEMGHVMGMRHNFAGSYFAPMEAKEIEARAQEFSAGNWSVAAPFASTVMDYLTAVDDVILGNYIKNEVLPYDKSVMEWGYSNVEAIPENKGFCTDEDLQPEDSELSGRKLVGCAVFDSSPNPIMGELRGIEENRKNLLHLHLAKVLNRYIKNSNSRWTTLDDVLTTISPPKLNIFLLNYRGYLSRQIGETDLLTVDGLASKSWKDKSAVNKVSSEKLDAMISESRGAAGALLRGIPTEDGYPDLEWINREKEKLFNSRLLKEGATYSGNQYVLSEAEIVELKSYYQKAVDDLNLKMSASLLGFMILPNKEVMSLNPQTGQPEAEAVKYRDTEAIKETAQKAANIVGSWILWSRSQIEAYVDGSLIKLPTRELNLEVSFLLGIFSPSVSPIESGELEGELKIRFLPILRSMFSEEDLRKKTSVEISAAISEMNGSGRLSPEAYSWAVGELSILGMLEQNRTPPEGEVAPSASK